MRWHGIKKAEGRKVEGGDWAAGQEDKTHSDLETNSLFEIKPLHPYTLKIGTFYRSGFRDNLLNLRSQILRISGARGGNAIELKLMKLVAACANQRCEDRYK